MPACLQRIAIAMPENPEPMMRHASTPPEWRLSTVPLTPRSRSAP